MAPLNDEEVLSEMNKMVRLCLMYAADGPNPAQSKYGMI